MRSTQRKKSTRHRQRSFPASNFAHPQAALSTYSTLSSQIGTTDSPAPNAKAPEHSLYSCIPALFVNQNYSITIQIYVVPSAVVYSRMLLAGGVFWFAQIRQVKPHILRSHVHFEEDRCSFVAGVVGTESCPVFFCQFIVGALQCFFRRGHQRFRNPLRSRNQFLRDSQKLFLR